jgi:hypothetical protein
MDDMQPPASGEVAARAYALAVVTLERCSRAEASMIIAERTRFYTALCEAVPNVGRREDMMRRAREIVPHPKNAEAAYGSFGRDRWRR